MDNAILLPCQVSWSARACGTRDVPAAIFTPRQQLLVSPEPHARQKLWRWSKWVEVHGVKQVNRAVEATSNEVTSVFVMALGMSGWHSTYVGFYLPTRHLQSVNTLADNIQGGWCRLPY